MLDSSSPLFKTAEPLRLESVITVGGQIVPRGAGRGQSEAADG